MTAITRRHFAAVLGGAAAWPLAARAQQPAMPVVGFVNAGSLEGYRPMVAAFRQGLQESGYAEGHDVAIEYHWADSKNDRLPAIVADLVRRQVTVIAATSTPAALAAKAATTTIPIVFEVGSDPIELGLVASLSRPGGNVTGVTQLGLELAPKRLEVLHELLPTARVMALLVNPTNQAAAERASRAVLSAAETLGLKLHVLNATSERDFDGVFENLIQLQRQAVSYSAAAMHYWPAAAASSLRWRFGTRCPRWAQTASLSRLAAWRAIAAGLSRLIVSPAATRPAFSKAKSPASCRFSSPRTSSCP
jgi:putative ABC transport system substrate-binding protein